MAAANALSQISPELVAMMAGGVSVHVASRDARLVPSVMRAMGSRVDAERGSVTVFLERRQCRQLLADIEAGGPVAVMFSEPATHRTAQLKATRASLRPAADADRPTLAAYVAAMERQIASVGYPPEMARAMLSCRLDDLVALTIEPEQVFEQTPGPKAGTLVAGAPT